MQREDQANRHPEPCWERTKRFNTHQATHAIRRYVSMQIDWPIASGVALVVILSHVLLLRRLITTRRQLALVESEQQQTERDLLRCRTEHARELAELKAEHAKVAMALQGNVKDLSALHRVHREKAPSAWNRPQAPNVTTIASRIAKRSLA
jgi:hypothetical protein